MLHEHQNPAGGGVPLKNMNNAFKYYGRIQGWDEEDIKAKAYGIPP